MGIPTHENNKFNPRIRDMKLFGHDTKELLKTFSLYIRVYELKNLNIAVI